MSVQVRHRKKKGVKTTIVNRASKYRTVVLGFILIMIGLASVMITFDVKPNFGVLFAFSNYRDWLGMWPFVITILGFVFVIYDYLKNSSKQKYK